MGLKQLLVSFLAIGYATAATHITGAQNSMAVNHPEDTVEAADKITPVGYLMSTKVNDNAAASGSLVPSGTQFFLNFPYETLCYPGDVKCTTPVAPSILFLENGAKSQITLNSTATPFGFRAPTQIIYIDYLGALRYITPPQTSTINNAPFYNWGVAKSNTTGHQILKYLGNKGQDAPAPFYLCPRNTGPVFSPPQYPVVYQLYVGVKGFFRNLNTTGCFETEVNLAPSKIGAYLFG